MPPKRKRLSESRAKNYSGTLFFPVRLEESEYAETCKLFGEFVEKMSQFRGVSWQMEKAPTTGKIHIQWNILFTNPVSFSKLKDDLGQIGVSPHIEVTRNPKAAWDYTAKAESRVCGPFAIGQGPKTPGERTDLTEFVNDCKALGAADAKALEDFEMKHLPVQAKYPRLYDKYVGRYEQKRVDKTRVLVFWGEPGTGKSRFAHHLFQAFNDHVHPSGVFKATYPPSRSSHIAWFAGYEQHALALFDEFEGQFPLSLMKDLTGDLECKVKVGNGQNERQWNVELLVICSNSNPESWYGVRNDVFRRFDMVLHFDYHPDYPLNVSKGQAYELDVVRHSVITVEQCKLDEDGRVGLLREFSSFQAAVPDNK